MSTATISGGLYVGLALSSSETQIAQNVFAAMDQSDSQGAVFSSTTEIPEAGAYNVYDITPTSGSTYSLPVGGQAIVLQGSAAATLNGLAGDTSQFLVGNSGNDTINTNGGSGTVIAGDGANTISATTGPQTIYTGTGNDTITLGTGNDTVTAFGSATVTGGSGSLLFHGGVNSKVYAGSGSETLFGGSGTTNFYGSTSTSGVDSMVGGTGRNFFEGGAGHDTMVSGASTGSSSDIFDFNSSVSGGTHTITGFTHGTDIVELQGYSSSSITSDTVSGGNTVITLEDGTSITVKGITNLSSSDIKFSH